MLFQWFSRMPTWQWNLMYSKVVQRREHSRNGRSTESILSVLRAIWALRPYTHNMFLPTREGVTWCESRLRDRCEWAKHSHWKYVYAKTLYLNAIFVFITYLIYVYHTSEPNHCCYRHSFAPCILLIVGVNIPVDIGALLAAVVVNTSFSSWIYVCEPITISFSFVTIRGSSYCTLDAVNICVHTCTTLLIKWK